MSSNSGCGGLAYLSEGLYCSGATICGSFPASGTADADGGKVRVLANRNLYLLRRSSWQ